MFIFEEPLIQMHFVIFNTNDIYLYLKLNANTLEVFVLQFFHGYLDFWVEMHGIQMYKCNIKNIHKI